MDRTIIFALVVILLHFTDLTVGFSLRTKYLQHLSHVMPSSISTNDEDVPLLLTALISAGKIQEARNLSCVVNLMSNITSFSGFFTVNVIYNSSLFFWFFPAELHAATAPVLVWLQGGPGKSSLFGLFNENGPFFVDNKYVLQRRNTSWTTNHSVIYVDNPVGTGFSFTNHEKGYAKTEDSVAQDLYSLLTQFFTLFPEYINRELYLTGESYAGKYITGIGRKIHIENHKYTQPLVRINLKGIAIFNGFLDPVSMLMFGEYLNNLGLLDQKQLKHFQVEERKAKKAIRKRKWKKAFEIVDKLMTGDLNGVPYFTNATGFTYHYNILFHKSPPEHENFNIYLQGSYVRQAIHVENRHFTVHNYTVEKFLIDEFYKPSIHWMEELLDAGYRVLICAGQLDILVSSSATEQMLKKLRWRGGKLFHNAERKQWRIRDEIVGYVKSVKNLTYLFLLKAGHYIPYDQPDWSLQIIRKFIAGIGFDNNTTNSIF